MRARPNGSCTLAMSGGAVQPVSSAANRDSRPLGINSSARPTAKAACGTASRPPSQACTRAQARLPCRRVTSHSISAKDSSVLALPTHRLKRRAGANCESASKFDHAAASNA